MSDLNQRSDIGGHGPHGPWKNTNGSTNGVSNGAGCLMFPAGSFSDARILVYAGLCWFMLGETTKRGLKDATPFHPAVHHEIFPSRIDFVNATSSALGFLHPWTAPQVQTRKSSGHGFPKIDQHWWCLIAPLRSYRTAPPKPWLSILGSVQFAWHLAGMSY